MKYRKPSYAEQKAELEAAKHETARRLSIVDGELDELLEKLKTYSLDVVPPKSVLVKIAKARREMASLKVNLQSIKSTERRLGIGN